MIPEWLKARASESEISKLVEVFRLFADEGTNREQLSKSTEDVADIEKRLVPHNPEQLVDPELKERILICSVGFRPLPVILTTLIVRPKKLYLLHSVESRRTAEEIREDIAVRDLWPNPDERIILRSLSLTDTPENYDHLRNILTESPNGSFLVDSSGGVKVMGLSLATAAFWHRVPVVYQLGEEVKGIIKPFSAKLITLDNPFVYFGSTELRSIQNLFHSGDYDAADALCDNMREGIRDLPTLGKLDILQEFIRVYSSWDSFAHSRLEDDPIRKTAELLRAVHDKMARFGLNIADDSKIADNIRFLKEVENSWTGGRRSINDRFRLVDIYASSQRRARAGKYDDAVARLYRCLEMSASICLVRDCGIDNLRNPNLHFFEKIIGDSKKVEAAFEKGASYTFPAGRSLGLRDQMTLLELSNQPVHRQVAGNYGRMHEAKLLEMRNKSILAHGSVPISEDEYRKFDRWTRTIVSFVVGKKGEFEKLLQRATHPIIAVEL
ncbi:MAG: TIGR02710 family CRISPR-associated protein [Caldilineaceae bacterium SB0665_bin_25]|nr:TIGR02710 family CRISPR-associated protein [Caldilineaceae bacterium SB0665_bin_25]